jgi:hypothetical protein
VTADYQQIRTENIARYGWDTAVLDLIGRLYSDRTHFIEELIQNADDATAKEMSFELFADRLEVCHDGRPFTEADVRAICGVARSDKTATEGQQSLTKIGKFGIGFKSVYAYTRSPRIHSGEESFRIESYVRPEAVAPIGEKATRFVFPFDLEKVPAEIAVAEIGAALTALPATTLLFLRNISTIRTPTAVISRAALRDWRIWRRDVADLPGYQVEIAFDGEPVPASPLYVFLPTQKETFLGFLAQGPYRTTPARDNVAEHDPANQALAGETAALLVDIMRELRDEDRLTPEVLAALPLDPVRFPPGTLFRPLFDAVRAALAAEPLIPVDDGGYATAAEVKLAADPGLLELFGADQLFADPDLTPAVRDYLRDQIGVEELTPRDAVQRATAEFLEEQSDEWITRFYAFLYHDSGLWELARTCPVIRLEDGSQAALADGPVYLPGTATEGFRTVRRGIASHSVARRFLDVLEIATPDVVDRVLDVVLPQYGLLTAESLDAARHDADLEVIMHALEEAPAARRDLLLDWLRDTAFLIGENAATGAQLLLPPGDLYVRSRELERYFDGNPDAWFASDRYGPWLVQLRGMGVRDTVDVQARDPGPLGYIVIADDFASHVRGLDGFDPDARIDGLDFALSHPSHARSEYVWNHVLIPNRQLVAGIVEQSVRESFADATRETVRSGIAAAAQQAPWLPAPDGTFRRPAELSVEDLPPAYTRDSALAQSLDMAQPVIAQAARQLGIPLSLLWSLSSRPDLIALLQRELDR